MVWLQLYDYNLFYALTFVLQMSTWRSPVFYKYIDIYLYVLLYYTYINVVIYIYIYSNVVCLCGFSSHQQVANNQFNWWDPANDSKSSCGYLPFLYIYIYVLLLRLLWKLNHNRKTSKLQRTCYQMLSGLARACGILQHVNSTSGALCPSRQDSCRHGNNKNVVVLHGLSHVYKREREKEKH